MTLRTFGGGGDDGVMYDEMTFKFIDKIFILNFLFLELCLSEHAKIADPIFMCMCAPLSWSTIVQR